jgi:hypothetical protein
MKAVYRLKRAVLVRFVAEVIVALACGILPLIACFNGFYSHHPWFVRPALLSLCLIAWVVLPFYGFITLFITADDPGITLRSLCKRKFCPWDEMKSIVLRSTWRWRRYVVTTAGGAELNIPTWLNAYESLIERIREKIPGGLEPAIPKTRFRNNTYSVVTQIGKSVLGLVFCVFVWVFAICTFLPKSPNLFDRTFVIVFALLVSAIFCIRTFFLVLMPVQLETSDTEISLQSVFYKLKLPWSEIRKVISAPPWLPEGHVIKTKRGDFFIAESIDSCDELIKQIEKNVQIRLAELREH